MDPLTASEPVRYDLLVTNARLVTPGGVRAGALAVLDGRIAKLLADTEPLPAATRTLDAENRYLLPGVIDSHVHFRTPGSPTRRTGRMAAGPPRRAASPPSSICPTPSPHCTTPNKPMGKRG